MAEEDEIRQRSSFARKTTPRGSQVAFEGIELQEIRTSQHSEKRKSLRRELGRKLSVIKGHSPYTVKFPLEKHKTKANYIKTTKYSLLTFVPLNLYYQFKRFYNFYFLLGALAIFAGFSSLSVGSQIAPLMMVLTFSAAKEAIEDFNRYRADTLANTTACTVIKNGKKEIYSSQDLQPGDIIYMEKGQKFNVDCILLASSYEDGTIFVETAELDGETNLKRKSGLAVTQDFTLKDYTEFTGQIECEAPNENLLSFEGRFFLEKLNFTTSLSMLNMAPRGAVLRNTEFCYGAVVYSGLNTKIMKNLKKGAVKSSKLEAQLNSFVLYAFLYNGFLLVTSVVFEYFRYDYIRKREIKDELAYEWYLGFKMTNPALHVWSSVISFFTLYTYVIPISLFVSIELVRLGQATYMVWDPLMQHKRENPDGTHTMIPMRANNSNLNEELGNVDYIFSDKTGTLTQNVMKMDKWYIDGYCLDEMGSPGIIYDHIQNNAVPFHTREQMNLFLVALSLCHGVIPALDEKTGKMIYESQSPDESALLQAAEQNSFKLKHRSKKEMQVEIMGVVEKFEVLLSIEFNSTRKRMSVIVKNGDGIRLYCKGADNIMMARLDPNSNQEILKKTEDMLTVFSNIGLRTLVIGYRSLSEQEFTHFKNIYDEAECSLVDREERIGEASDLVETGLTLLGCSAIEDKLQDKVPETIENLLQVILINKAGIKLWLLTGDKQETAINIGISSRLINRNMKLLILQGDDPKQCEVHMDTMITEMQRAPKSQIFAVVVNGNVLSQVFAGDKQSKDKFLTIGKRCKTVICSRVTPLQKALVVRLVRQNVGESITLAIGDGANDVSMIQEAHVGVGIMGREGTQAVRAADFAFGEFRFLQRLLTVHGRYNSVRLSNMVFYSFYKNFVFISIQWVFGFVNGWSGQVVYEELFFIAFNVIFTSLPPLFYGLFEKDVPEVLLEKYPQLYREVKNGLFWNAKLIFGWFFSAIYHSFVIFIVVYYVNYEGAVDPYGRSTGYWAQCYFFSGPLLIVVLVKQILISRFWIWINAAGIAISFVMNAVVMFALVLLDWYTYSDYGTAQLIHSIPAFYLFCVILPAVCIVPDLLVSQVLSPTDTDLMLEHAAKNDIKI